MIRAEGLESREGAVQWQVDLRRSEESVQQLASTSDRFEHLALQDPLTGIANRRCLEQKLSTLLSRNADGFAPLSVVFIDVDRFKQVNDGNSHLVGDQVLKAIANVLVQNLREHDLAARLAGAEFVILLQHVGPSEAAQVCERISAMVASFAWDSIAQDLAITVSVGVATAEVGDTAEFLLHRSDLAMYAAKRVAAEGFSISTCMGSAGMPDQIHPV